MIDVVTVYSESKMAHEVKLHTARYRIEQLRLRSITHHAVIVQTYLLFVQGQHGTRFIHSINDNQCKVIIINVTAYSESKIIHEIKLHTAPYSIKHQ